MEANVQEVTVDDVAMSEGDNPTPDLKEAYPSPVISLSEEKHTAFVTWLDIWLEALISEQQPKLEQWAAEERAYRALPEYIENAPYEGSCDEVVPAIAMAVDPIHARLSTGIYKSDPVFRMKPLKKSFAKIVPSFERWVEYYQKYKLNLRRISAPRFFDLTKHGTMIFKTVYDRESYSIKTYDTSWEVIKKEVTRFSGPRVFGIPIQNLLFPARYQNIQDCPIVAERIITTINALYKEEQSKKLTNVKKLEGQEQFISNVFDIEQQDSANHKETIEQQKFYLEVFEVWADYDIDGDGVPESVVVTYHKPTQTILQLRYNWYFHQRKPYTVIPYTVTSASIYGLGIGEMVAPFQRQLTQWHRMATDNAYLANIRMFIAKKDAGIENRPKMYSGRVFRVDDPKTDLIPFGAADVYPSTVMMQQNLFGLAEKRTGISDYLTGRESPIVGSKATATGTMALIQEGTRRVEEVLENIRNGYAEIIQNCISIWIQYGLDGLDDLVFGDDVLVDDLQSFFASVRPENVDGALAIDLSATDAANNKTAQQQMQLAIIQVMMNYLERLVQAGQMAFQAQQTEPKMAELLVEIMTSARNMFHDLLQKYDIRNPDDYLPDLEKFFDSTLANGQLPEGGIEGLIGGITGGQGLPMGMEGVGGPPRVEVPRPGVPGGAGPNLPFAG